MEIPFWIKFKKDKKSVLIYDIKRRNLYRADSSLLYLILRLLSSKNTNDQIISYLSKKFEISLLNAQKAFQNCLYQLKLIIEGETVEATKEFKCSNYMNDDFTTPLGISVLITYNCNLRCKHCLVGSFRYNKYSEMQVKEIKKLAAQMRQYEVFKVALNGGEPLVRKDFMDILEIFYHHEIPIEIATNGIALSKDKIEKMNDYKVVGYTLSVEGSKSETHDFIRGNGTFKRVLSAIANIKKYSSAFELNVEVTYGKHNLTQIEEIIKLLLGLGVDKIKFARMKPWGWGTLLSYLIPTSFEIINVNDKIWDLQEKYQKFIQIEGDVPKMRKKRKGFGCNINIGFEIQPDGAVLPCRIFEQRRNRHIILGNIKSGDILKIWNSPRARMIRRYVDELSKSNFCPDCRFTYFCATNYCLAENYLKFGKFIPTNENLKKCKN